MKFSIIIPIYNAEFLEKQLQTLEKQSFSKDDFEIVYVDDGSDLEYTKNYKELFQKLEIAIHQFSKRQMTWFRKMENEGYKIDWINWSLPTIEKTNYVLNKLKKIS